jgi:hypothetical protein
MRGDTFSFGMLESQACKFQCSVKTCTVSAIFNCKWYYTKDQCKVKFVYSKCRGHSCQPLYFTLDYYTILY